MTRVNFISWGQLGLVGAILLAAFFVFSPTREASADDLFSDSFGSSGSDLATVPGWVDSDGAGSNCRVVANSSNLVGSPTVPHARLEQNCTLTQTVDTTGFENIVLSFYCKGDGTSEDADNLLVEYSIDGTNFILLATLDIHLAASTCPGDVGGPANPLWSSQLTYPLPVTTEDNPLFAIRFTGQSNSASEDARIDDVLVTGDPIPLATCEVLVGSVGPAQATPGCVIIRKEAPGSSREFDFEWDDPQNLGPFQDSLGDGDEIITVLRGGYYFFNENVPSGWNVEIECSSQDVTFTQSFSIDESIGFLEFTVDTVNTQGTPLIFCVFTNTEEDDEDDHATRTPTPTPTRTPTRTPTPTATPDKSSLGGPIGSFFDLAGAARDRREGSDPTPRPTTAAGATTAPAVVRPPSTGDAGLR